MLVAHLQARSTVLKIVFGGGGGVALAKQILTSEKEKEGNLKNPNSWGRGGEHSFSLNFIVDFLIFHFHFLRTPR